MADSRLTLSHQEVCFAILIESHAVVSTSLFEFALKAVKASNPTDWKETVCSCFGTGVGRPVRQRLDNNLPLTDIYAVSRIIHCRISDVAKFCGGEFLNPREKERLSLQVQGVETVRHWAFHSGQLVSVGELRSNIALLRSVVTTLSRHCSGMNHIVDELSLLQRQAETLANPICANSEYFLSRDSIGSALLYSSLTELKSNYGKLFDEEENCGDCLEIAQPLKDLKKNDFPTFLKQIRKTIQERLTGTPHQNFNGFDHINIGKCKNLLVARNALAHNVTLTFPKIDEALGDVERLLRASGLCCRETTLAAKALALIRENDSQRGEKCRCLLQDVHYNMAGRHMHALASERILRPRGQHFVGRERELNTIKSGLSNKVPRESSVVFIFGPAGVGKSYLATEAAHALIETYSRQTWLDCSDNHELGLDLSLCKKQNAGDNCIASQELTTDWRLTVQDHRHSLADKQLFVLDNVCSSTMHTIYEMVIKRGNSAVITARSTTVKAFFQRMLPKLHVIHLGPFSTSESWSLLGRKTKRSEMESDLWTLIEKTLNGVLGNLPLCVNIYSSLVAVTEKKKCFDIAERKCQFSASSKHWGDIEERFGDRHHVRGLTGIVKCAKKYLQDHPLVVLLLAKIVLTNSKSIPWEVVSKTDARARENICGEIPRANFPGLDKLLSGLLGVVDWLFSDCAQGTLEMCRSALEELGLISWVDSTSTVCIHQLTLESVRDELEGQRLFLCDLFTNNPFCIQSDDVSQWALAVSSFLCGELLLQTLSSCVNTLHEHVRALKDDFAQPQEASFLVFEFLAKFLHGDKPMHLRELLTYEQLGVLISHIAIVLYIFSIASGLEVEGEESASWWKLYTSPPLDKNWPKLMGIHSLLKETPELFRKGMTAEVKARLELAQNWAKFNGLYDKELSFLFHCLKATVLRREAEELASKMYMNSVSDKYLLLSIWPTTKDVCSAINETVRNNQYHPYRERLQTLTFTVWASMFRLKIQEISNGHVDMPLQQTGVLLIILSQQRQCLLLRDIMQQQAAEQQNESKITLSCSFLIDEAMKEAGLWEDFQMNGRSLRALVKTYHVIMEAAFPIVNTGNDRPRLALFFWSRLKQLIVSSCLNIWQVGNLSLIGQIFKSSPDNPTKTSMFQDLSKWIPYERQEGNSSLVSALCSNEFQELQAMLTFFRELQILHGSNNLQEALHNLIAVFMQLLDCSNTQRSLTGLCLVMTINYIVWLMVILGQTRCLQVFNQLVTLSVSRNTPLPWKDTLQWAVAALSNYWKQFEPLNLYESFILARKSFTASSNMSARKDSLKCWRELIYFFDKRKPKSQGYMIRILGSMISELAQNLYQLYTNEEMYIAAEWFLKFHIKWFNVKRAKVSILAAKYSIDYCNYLKKRGRYHEGLEQCQIVERDLQEEFGDDYLEWLTDMPNVAMIRREVEEEVKLCSERVISVT